ncbi:MAG: hypothetical protein MI924_36855 [Chloroflexales bacterium]|nr:hypothetical protein [Chloroflexales bacterium]
MSQQSNSKTTIRKVETRRWDKAIAPNHNHHTVPAAQWGVRKVEAQRWDKAIAPNHNHHTVPGPQWG